MAATIPNGSQAPGAVICEAGTLVLNQGRETRTMEVANLGDRPIQVGSHFHFFEVNRRLRFDRVAALGFRLDIPAGTAVRFEPGDTKRVTLVALAGERRVQGLNGLVNGALDDPEVRVAAIARAEAQGFCSTPGESDGD